MNLILDVDEVILDWQAAFVKWSYQAHGLKLDPAGPNSYDLTGWAGTKAMSLVHQFSSTPSFGEIPYTSGTLTFFEDFQRLGLPHSIKLITSCGVEDCTVNARRKKLKCYRLVGIRISLFTFGCTQKGKAGCLPARVDFSRGQRKPCTRRS
jgi:hypothetical protein